MRRAKPPKRPKQPPRGDTRVHLLRILEDNGWLKPAVWISEHHPEITQNRRTVNRILNKIGRELNLAEVYTIRGIVRVPKASQGDYMNDINVWVDEARPKDKVVMIREEGRHA